MANKRQVIEHFRGIDLKSPSDIIIQQIKELISSGVLRPGDRLPAERALAERFRIGRGHIREAIKKLEFYGILKTLPQSGTIVTSLGAKALEGLLTNVLNLEKEDFESLMETRALLEIQAARLAATRASEAEIVDLERTHEEFRRQVQTGSTGLQADQMFHLKVAECARNSVLQSLIRLLTPDTITLSKSHETIQDGRFLVALQEHEAVLNGIRSKDPDQAAAAMEEHIRKVRLQVEAYLPRRSPAGPA
jgi:GntR family transcriptional repressor for pyruvate dehydrogenase complex